MGELSLDPSEEGTAVWRWWWVSLAVGAVAIGAYPFVPYDVPADAIYLALAVACVAAIAVGIVVHRPVRRTPWVLMLVGQLSWTVGEVVYTWREDVLHISPSPSAADIAYLAAYPLLGAGLVLAVRRTQRPDPTLLIDAAVPTLGLGALLWVVVGSPIVQDGSTPLLERVVDLAYPVGDVLLLGLLFRLMMSSAVRTTAFGLLAAAIVPQVVADALFAMDAGAAQVADMLWMASYVLWGAAALHPTMRELSDGTPRCPRPAGTARLLSIVSGALILPMILAVELTWHMAVDSWTIVVGGIGLILLAGARIGLDFLHLRMSAAQRAQLERDLFRAASEDPLTGVANRTYAVELVQAALERNRHVGAPTGLLFVDLDGFAPVNASVGPQGGDDLLRRVAARLVAVVGAEGRVGRLAGDEFLVLLERPDSQNSVVETGERILRALDAPHDIDGRPVSVGASIGIAVSMDAGADAAEFLREADAAARRAKQSGRGRVEVFDEALRRELQERDQLEQALLHAIDHDELTLHYQPVVGLPTGVVDGYEALVRWDRPAGSLIGPEVFVPIAETSDLICRIDTWVLHEATRQLVEWTRADPATYEALTVAVNISGRHLASGTIVDDVRAALDASGLPADRLALEITETVLVDVPTASLHLQTLRELGVSISIDDFGTGYTSIGQLRTLPADALKIDRSFIASTAPGTTELIELMVAAAHACGLLVVAEGIERPEQLDRLGGLLFDAAQGFYLSPPRAAADVSRTTGAAERHLRAVRDLS